MIATDLETYAEAYESALIAGKAGPEDIPRFLPPPGADDRLEVLLELLRITLELRWQPGQTDALSAFRPRFPELFGNSRLLGLLAFEEYRLRAGEQQQVSRAEFTDRYGLDVSAWPDLAARADESPDGDASALAASWAEFSQVAPGAAAGIAVGRRRLPAVGERFGPFQLAALLGQGAFGKVFLAQQTELASRLVALKITSGPTAEADRLARMQHSNIVPIYSVHRRGRLSAVCMPYLGGVTLADLIASLKVQERMPKSAESFVSTMAARQAELSTVLEPKQSVGPETPETPSAPRADQALAAFAARPLETAVAWIMARVAAGLAHAHERGIVHRDLKPANILIGDDGEPLILDFNLASDNSTTGAHLARLGGTLPYMAAEHLAMFQGGGSSDARSDVFSLGVVLYESLTREHPYPIRRGPLDETIQQMLSDRRELTPEPLRRRNPAVSPGLASIVEKCLAPDPANRYQDAGQLHDDLQRHLDHRPLRYAREKSLTEVAQKWCRRHPRLASASTVALVACVAAAIAGSIWALRETQHAGQVAQSDFRTFAETVPEARSLLIVEPYGSDAEQRALEAARIALGQYRVLDNPKWYEHPSVRRLPPASQQELGADIAELLVLLARRKEGRPKTQTDITLGPAPAELRQLATASWEQLNGLPIPAAIVSAVSNAAENESISSSARAAATELLLTATDRLHTGKLAEAAADVERLTMAFPQDVVAWLLLGHCRSELGDFTGAEAAYTVCLALRQDQYLGWAWRGIARLRQNRFPDAEADFSQALTRRPQLTAVQFNRALARQKQGKHAAAIEDINACLQAGLSETRAYFVRSRSYAALGNKGAANRDRQEGLTRAPHDCLSWVERGMARLQDKDAAAAEQDLLAAVRLEPYSRFALMNLAHVQSEKLGKTEEAIASLDQLLRVVPADTVARGSRGVLLARLGKSAAAVADARDVLQGQPPPLAVYQAACVYALLSGSETKHRLPALSLVQKAIVLQPSFRIVAREDDDLKNLRLEPGWTQLTAVPNQKTASRAGENLTQNRQEPSP